MMLKPYVFEVGRALCPAFRRLCREFEHLHPGQFLWEEGDGFMSRPFYINCTEELIQKVTAQARDS